MNTDAIMALISELYISGLALRQENAELKKQIEKLSGAAAGPNAGK